VRQSLRRSATVALQLCEEAKIALVTARFNGGGWTVQSPCEEVADCLLSLKLGCRVGDNINATVAGMHVRRILSRDWNTCRQSSDPSQPSSSRPATEGCSHRAGTGEISRDEKRSVPRNRLDFPRYEPADPKICNSLYLDERPTTLSGSLCCVHCLVSCLQGIINDPSCCRSQTTRRFAR